jgi:hypothetical protein
VVLNYPDGFYYAACSGIFPIFEMPKLWVTSRFLLKLLQLLRHTTSPTNIAKNLPQMQNQNPSNSQFLPRMRTKTTITSEVRKSRSRRNRQAAAIFDVVDSQLRKLDPTRLWQAQISRVVNKITVTKGK